MAEIEVERLDYNPDAATVARGACGTCDVYALCKFHLRKNGGFKGTGIHNIGYRLVTDQTENSNGKEDFCSCRQFINSGLQNRVTDAAIAAAKGLRGELVSIVAQEGQEITMGMQMGFNGRNQIARPIRQLIPALKAAGYEVNPDDVSGNVEFRDVEFKIAVPKYKHIDRDRSTYSQKIAQRELDENRDNSDIADEIWAEARAKNVAKALAARTGAAVDADGFEMDEGEAAK